MKKSVKVIIVAAIIIFIIAVVCILAVLTRPKEALTIREFNSAMQERGYSIVNAIEQFEEYDYIDGSYLAIDRNQNYQIEFYILENSDIAMQFYESNKAIFESSKGSISSQTDISVNNYSKYALSSNGRYKYICRIDNTVIYVDAEDEYKDVIKGLTEELGY